MWGEVVDRQEKMKTILPEVVQAGSGEELKALESDLTRTITTAGPSARTTVTTFIAVQAMFREVPKDLKRYDLCLAAESLIKSFEMRPDTKIDMMFTAMLAEHSPRAAVASD